MKTKIFIFIIACLSSISSFADDKFVVDGISYSVYSRSTHNGELVKAKVEVEAGTEKYSGNIMLPEKVTYNGFDYIVGCIGSTAFRYCDKLLSVKLPSSLERINAGAFYGCSSLTGIVIPKSVVIVQKQAFGNCDALSSIVVEDGNEVYNSEGNCNAIIHSDTLVAGCKSTTIPESVKCIGEYAFYMNSGLVSIRIPDAVTSIGERAFTNCNNLNQVEIGSSSNIMKICDNAFSGCGKLNGIQLPKTIKSIHQSSFNGCSSLTEIFIPKSVTLIGKQAFAGCDALSSIIVEDGNEVYNSKGNCNAIIHSDTLVAGCKSTTIPESVKCIGEYAFYMNSGLVSIRIPDAVTSIGERAFTNCNNLNQVEIGSSSNIMKICDNAFSGCGKLNGIQLPKTIKSIHQSSFNGCSSLTEIFIPKSVTLIGKQAFAGCDALSSIVVEDGNEVYNSEGNCNAIIHKDTLIVGCKTTVIPENVIYIDEYSFYMNSGLEYIEIPNKVKGIGSRAFSSCNNLKDVFIYVIDPFTIDNYVFYGLKNAVLYVPEGKIETYREKGWGDYFSSIEEIIPNPTVIEGGLTFEIYQKREFAKLLSQVPENKHVVIPSAISYNGIEYLVKEISNSAFANSDIVTLTIPESIINIGSGVVANCYSLTAIEWNAKFKASSEFINNIVNPNLLFYVQSPQFCPESLRNVIVGEIAESIELTDAEHGDFYCPKTFTAKKVSYTHNYSLETKKGVCEGWETIALPFDVQKYMTSNGEAKPYKVASSGERLFWLRELTTSGMIEANGIKANVPYIISMPNWEGYQDYYNINGDVVFSAQNVTIEKTDINAVDATPRHFWPNYQNLTRTSNCFALNKQHLIPSDTYHGEEHLAGSVFLGNLRDIKPFEAYFTYDGASAAKAIAISDLMDGTTFIKSIDNQYGVLINGVAIKNIPLSNSTLGIYSTSGQLIKMVVLSNGCHELSGLQSGIYIINGIKVHVK